MRFAAYIPNAITIARMLMAVPIAWALLAGRFELALLLFLIAGLSDGVDGFLAKHFGWVSWWGGILDPLADKTLLTATYLVLAGLGLLPVWLVVATLLRDLVILTGALYYHFRVARLVAEPRVLSKIHTTVQIMLGLAVVLNAAYATLPSVVEQLGVGLVLVTTVLSGGDYVSVWLRRARLAERGQ